MLTDLLNTNPADIMAGVQEKTADGAMLKLREIEYFIGSPLTDEQRNFAYNFNRDIITFANPGTGKTHTLTTGILTAQTYWGIQPTKMFCMSYTNAATDEIKGRYMRLARKLNTYTGVQFGTFHSLANKILADSYHQMSVVKEHPPEELADSMASYIQQIMPEYAFDRKKARRIAKVIANLNSAYIFDDDNIESKYEFKCLEMPLDKFKELRLKWFERGLILNTIEQGEIPLFCLYALKNRPEVAEIWKGRYEIMIVDEFQDLSLLDLEILSMVAKKLIVVGDMKQQIYVFSGACPEIVEAYKRMRPDAVECRLTQSFRCPQPIADLATRVIAPNMKEDANFTGRSGSENEQSQDIIKILDRKDLDWNEAFKDTNNDNLNDILILYRNNASTIPVIDTLYESKIPYRCPKFVKVNEIPVIRTLCDLINAAWQPSDIQMVTKALCHFPEFRWNQYNIPVIAAMKSSHKNLFEVNYRYEDERSKEILNAMREAAANLQAGKTAGAIMIRLKPVYDKYILPNEWINADEVPYYLNMAAPVANNRTYPDMIMREQAKEMRALECQSANIGVRCYTMHSSKGLEGKTVYLLDVNEGVFPNYAVLQRKHKAKCDYDASIDVRSERNLLYVAITRARERIYISYSNGALAMLLQSPEQNEYSYFDKVYRDNYKFFDDSLAFERDMLGGRKNNESI